MLLGNLKKIFLLALLLCHWPALAAPQEAGQKVVHILVEDAADPWSKPDGSGYANDLVLAAFKEVGIQVKLGVVPYSRCKSLVLSGTVPACFSMGWLPEFQGVLKFSSKPLFKVNADVFEHIERPLPRTAESSCKFKKGDRIALTRGYEYPDQVIALRSEGAIFLESVTDINSLKMLAAKRFLASIIMTNDYQSKMHKSELAGTEQKVRFAFNCGVQTGSIGFSLKHAEGLFLSQQFDRGFQIIEKNGVIKKIQAKWFPQ